MKKRSSHEILTELLIGINEMIIKSENYKRIKINLLYGIFLENNKFIVCVEEKTEQSQCPVLLEFFTNDCLGHGHIVENEIICNWRNGGKIYLDGTIPSQEGFCVPIANLLNKFSTHKSLNGKDIANLYLNINKYIRQNPDFTIQLFNSEIEKNKMI